MLGPKVAIWRSRPYRMFVASQECFGCRIEGYSQCAHENAGKGRGLKSGDDRTFPLCATRPGKIGCHVEHDQCIDQTREMRNEDALVYVARMQQRARAAGWKLPMPAAPEAPARSDEQTTVRPQ
jgi:hypothetical protein